MTTKNKYPKILIISLSLVRPTLFFSFFSGFLLNPSPKKEKLRQPNIKKACDKDLKAVVHQYIACFDTTYQK